MEAEIYVTTRCRMGHFNIFKVLERQPEGAVRYCSYCRELLPYEGRVKFNQEINEDT